MSHLAKMRAHPTHFLSSNQPHDNLDPCRDAHAHHPLCYDMAFPTSLQILKPSRYEQGHVVYRHQAPDTTIWSSSTFGILIVIFPLPLTKVS